MKVLLFLAKGFETMEFSPFVDVLGWANNDFGIDVSVETCGFHNRVLSAFNIPVLVDKTIDQVCPEDYAALAVPGGFEEYGFYEEAYDQTFLELIRDFHAKGKVIASVCVGALPLGKSGILANRRATTYHLGDGKRQNQLRDFNATVISQPVVVDGKIITSYCPETAPEVAFRLLEFLSSMEQMKAVKTAMGFE